MSHLTVIEVDLLGDIAGGQSRSVSAEGSVKTQVGEATVKAGKSSEESSRYIRCLDSVDRHAGMFGNRRATVQDQKDLCGPLLNKE